MKAALLLLALLCAAPAARAQDLDVRPQVLPSGTVVSTYISGDSVTTHVSAPGDVVRRIVLFDAPPLALAGPGKASAQAAAIDGEHARFRADLAALDGAASKHGGAPTAIRRDYRVALNGVAVTTTRAAADRMAALPYVRGVYEDRPMRTLDDETNRIIGADRMQAQGTGGRGVVVAIIDTGVDYTHPALGGGLGAGFKVIGGYDFVDGDDDPMDGHGHGTHVAGIVAGRDAAAGFTGVAPEASLLAYRVLGDDGSGMTSDIIAAIERAIDPDGNPATDDGADILNLSLGGSGHPDDPAAQAIDHATAAGVLCVVAAGNDGQAFSIGSPGVARTALTVGATDNGDMLAPFSSRGPVATTFENKPDVVAPGVAVPSSIPGGRYEALSGTSMATPHVAGAAALLLERHPSWSPATLKTALMQSAKDVGMHVWQQGAGRIDVPAADALPAVVNPGSLSFGNLDPAQATVVFERTLTVRSLSASAQTFSASASHAVPGAQVEVRPSSVQVAAGGTATFTVTARFEPGRLPFPQQIDVPYAGAVVVTGGGKTMRVPFSVTKTAQLVLRYDMPPETITILNEQGGIAGAYAPAEVVSFALPPGTYDILSHFNLPHGEIFTTGILYTEQVTVTGKHELRLNRTDVRHAVTIDPRDEQGQALPIDYLSLHARFADRYSLMTQFAAPVVYVSDASARLHLEAVTHSFTPASGIDYVVPVAHYDGVSGPVTMRNDPSAFREARTRYLAPPGATELFVVPLHYQRIGETFLTYQSWYREEHADHHRLRPPFVRTVRYGPNPSASFGYPYQSSVTYNTTGSGQPSREEGNANLIGIAPALAVTADGIDVYAHGSFETPVRSVRDGVLEERFGAAPLGMQARTWNIMDLIRLDTKHRAAFFYGSDGDIVSGRVTYTLSHGGTPLETGVLGNELGFHSPFVAPPDRYALRLDFEGGYVDDRPVRASARLAFDTRLPTNQLFDPDAPHLDGFRLTSGGQPVDALDLSQESAIFAVVRDTYNQGGIRPRPVASAQVFVRRLGETAWMELAAEREGDAFAAAWPTWAGAGYYDLRVAATDASGNTLDYEVAPGFRAGVAEGNRPPEAALLAEPAWGVEVDLDSLSGPLSFHWHAAADPDAGQQLRYRFRLTGPGVDTTMVMWETSVAIDLRGKIQPAGTYTWMVETTDGFVVVPATPRTFATLAPGVSNEPGDTGLPRDFVLDQNYPNPFNPTTTIRFGLPQASRVRLEVFDVLGRRVAVLADDTLPAGYHTQTWTASDLPSGLYFVYLRAGHVQQTRAVTLLK